VEHEHDEAVEAEGDAAVGGGAERRASRRKANLRWASSGRCEEVEDFGLDVFLVDTDGAAADFDAVEDMS